MIRIHGLHVVTSEDLDPNPVRTARRLRLVVPALPPITVSSTPEAPVSDFIGREPDPAILRALVVAGEGRQRRAAARQAGATIHLQRIYE